MPFGPGFPRPSVVPPRRFGCERKHCDVRRVADLLFGIAAEETDESNSVEVHSFLLFCPSVSGTRKRVGAAPKTRSGFSGGPARGNQNRNGAEGKAEASQAPGAARAPKQCRDKGWNRKRTGKQFRYVGRRATPGCRAT